jgi:hypothetical protein
MAVKFSDRDIAIIAGLAGAADFLTEGRFSAPVSRALKKAIRRYGPRAASATVRTIPRLAGSAIGATRFVAMRHPYVAAAVVTYEVVKNRQQIEQLLREGWEVIEDTGRAMMPGLQEEWGRFTTEGPKPITGVLLPEARIPRISKRKPSKFNKAVSAGMKAVKKSKFLGKPGKFTNSKKAFGTVTRTVSRLRKGSKVSSKGVLGTIKRAVKRYI